MRNFYKSILFAAALLLPFLCFAQYEGEHYIMHASGLHLAKTTSSAILESASAANPQKLTVKATSDGYYNILAADGTFLAQNGANQWNTGFIANGSGDVAKFSFESNGDFLKIKNKFTGKYLGVDEVKDGNWVFCDKSGTSTTHLWFLSDDVAAEVPGSAFNVIINPAAQRQEFEGFGVSLCWWAHMCGDWKEEKIDQIIEWLTSPEYLNFRIFRYNIGGGDDPENNHCDEHHMGKGKGLRAEMPGFKAYENSEYDWDADKAQITILRKIKEKRPDAIFEAFSNSAPWWMTYSGCCSGANSASQDNLKPEYYEAFAHYLVDVCKHFKDEYGIEFRTLEPFNEPMTNYWGRNGGQEGCHFSVNSQIEFLKVLYPILKESGLNTVISASDETDIAQQVKDFAAFEQADVLKYIGQINSHTYNGNVNACSNLSAQCAQKGMPLWMSEVGASGDGIQGNLNMAKHLIRDIRYIEPNAWLDWQYIEEGYDQWCLVQAGFSSQNYRRVNNFYVREHFSKYILPGYTFLTSTNENTLVARNPEGNELVIVVVNPEALEANYKFDLGLYKNIKYPTTAAYSTSGSYFNDQPFELKDSYLSFKLNGLSIATFVIPVEEQAAFTSELVDGAEYLIQPRNNASAAITARNGKVAIQDVNLAADQVWTLAKDGNNWTFTNRDGNKLTATDSYALSYTVETSGTQAFSISAIGNDYYKIEANNKAFDLEGEGSGTGTGVGMWDYGTSAAASHRQFRFFPLAERTNVTPEINGIFDAIASDEAIASFIPAQGFLSICNLGAEGGRITVCTLDGRIVYAANAAQASVEIPLSKGIYVANYTVAGKSQSKVVAIQ